LAQTKENNGGLGKELKQEAMKPIILSQESLKLLIFWEEFFGKNLSKKKRRIKKEGSK